MLRLERVFSLADDVLPLLLSATDAQDTAAAAAAAADNAADAFKVSKAHRRRRT